jgi:hypothetical protein
MTPNTYQVSGANGGGRTPFGISDAMGRRHRSLWSFGLKRTRMINKHLIPKTEFAELLNRAKVESGSEEAFHKKVWFAVADRILEKWNGVSYSFLEALTPGQAALVCCARFHRGAEYDFLTSITQSALPSLTLRAFETLQAHEYLELLRKLEAVFPGKTFPEYPEDMLSALRKQPDGYFEKVADRFVTGKGMKRPLHEYVFAHVTAHPEDFCSAT